MSDHSANSNSQSVIAYVALGSNLGDRAGNIHVAVDSLIVDPDIIVPRLSKLYDTAPVGGPVGSPRFLNAVAEITTTLSPTQLMNKMLEIEKELGRDRRDKWEPRPIDLDLLLFGDQIISTQELIVPHPLMHERRFVLEPLAELAPDAMHPAMGVSIKDLLAALE